MITVALAAVMDLPEVRTFLGAHYIMANVDVGRFGITGPRSMTPQALAGWLAQWAK